MSRDDRIVKYGAVYVPEEKVKETAKRGAPKSSGKMDEIEEAIRELQDEMIKTNRDNLDAMYNIDEDNLSASYRKKIDGKLTEAYSLINTWAESTSAGFQSIATWRETVDGKLGDIKSEEELNAAIKGYIEKDGEGGGKAVIESVVSGRFLKVPTEPVYVKPAGVAYGFEKTSDGYYTSTNKNKASSFSYGKFVFNSDKEQTITLRCISYGQSAYDYGIISEVGYSLGQNNSADSTNVLKTFKNASSASVVNVSVSIPAGESFITFKYIKNASTNSNGDYFKIAVDGYVASSESATSIISQSVENGLAQLTLGVSNGDKSSTITLKNGTTAISSETIQMTGLVSFTDLSTKGATEINGANITTGKINAALVDTSDLVVETVWLKFKRDEDDNETKVASFSSAYVNKISATVRVGMKEAIANTPYQYIELYATDLFLLPPGEDPGYSNKAIKIDVTNRLVIPNSRWAWGLGASGNEFGTVTAGEYSFGCDDTSGIAQNLYIDNQGNLVFHDRFGEDHIIVRT